MEIELDNERGQSVGSHIRLRARVFGISLFVDEIVTERNPPRRKVWETTDSPELLIIGHYRMGFEITPTKPASTMRVFIDYACRTKRPRGGLDICLLDGTPHGAQTRWSRTRLVTSQA
jgi:hypothetical protein